MEWFARYKSYIYGILIIVAAITGVIVFVKNIDYIKRLLFSTKKAYQKENISDKMKLELEELASQIYNDLLSTVWTDTNAISKAAVLTDAELVYMLKYYKSRFGKSLYKDLDEEIIVIGKAAKDKLLTRLSELGYGY